MNPISRTMCMMAVTLSFTACGAEPEASSFEEAGASPASTERQSLLPGTHSWSDSPGGDYGNYADTFIVVGGES